MSTATTLILRPIPASDRPETAPVLPTEISIFGDGRATAIYNGDHEDVEYDNAAELLRDHQVSAVEILGDDLSRRSIKAFRDEAGSAWDPETIADCDAALEGDSEALGRIARIFLDAKLAAVG